MKLVSLIIGGVLSAVVGANAAVYSINNVVTGGGATEALFQGEDNSLLSGGIVAMGYFPAGYTVSSSLGEINNTINNFTILGSALAGSNSPDLGGSFAGYVQTDVQGAVIAGSSALVDRPLYVFVGNASTLAASTAFALVQIAIIASDEPNEQTYLANPIGKVPTIGTVGAFVGDASGFGSSTYTTLKLAAVPEPSAMLLGAFGALGLLRRRR